MRLEPTPLRLELKDVFALHDDEEHDQVLVCIDKWMPAMRHCGLWLQKFIKQAIQQFDIVGEGWFDHHGSSSKSWRLFLEETFDCRLCQAFIYAHPSIN